jgi:hypothetical protein
MSTQEPLQNTSSLYQEDSSELELDLFGLLAYLLRHWAVLFLCTLLGLILGAGASALRHYLAESRSGESNAKIIARAENSLAAERSYLANSILTNIDPYEEAYASANVFVEVTGGSYALSIGGDNTISYTNTIARQIMQEYGRFVANDINYDELANDLGTAAGYISQVVSFSQNDTNGYFTIGVKHYSNVNAGKILDYVLAQIQNQRITFGSNIPQHTLSVSNRIVTTRSDSTLLGDQAADDGSISDEDFKNVYTLASEARIAKLEAFIADRQTPIKQRYVLLGGLLGFAAAICFYVMQALFAGILLSGSAAESYLRTLTLVSFPHSRNLRRRGIFDRMADTILGVSYRIADRQIYEALAEILYTRFLREESMCLGDEAGEKMRDVYTETGDLSAVRTAVEGMEVHIRHFLIIGDMVRAGEVEDLTKYLRADDLPGMDFEYMEAFREGYEAIDKVHDADQIILCVTIGKSSHMSLRKFLQVLRMYRKEIFGIVVYH